MNLVILQVCWHSTFNDLSCHDNLPHLAGLMDYETSVLDFVHAPSLSKLYNLLIGPDPVHRPLTYILTLPFLAIGGRSFFSPWALNLVIVLLICLLLVSFSKRLGLTDRFLSVALLLSFPAFIGLTRYYTIDLPLTVWFLGVVYVIWHHPTRVFGPWAVIILPLFFLVGIGLKSTAPLYIVAALFWGAKRAARKYWVFFLLGMLIISGYGFLVVWTIQWYWPALLPSWMVQFLELVQRYIHAPWYYLFLANPYTIMLRTEGTPLWVFFMFYPYYLLKAILFPSVLIMLLGLWSGGRPHVEGILHLFGLICSVAFFLTCIGLKNLNYLQPVLPLVAVITATSLEKLPRSMTVIFSTLIVLFNVTIGWDASFGHPLRLASAIPRDQFDRNMLGYYPHRPEPLDQSCVPNLELTSSPAIIMLDCSDNGAISPRYHRYLYGLRQPGLEVFLPDRLPDGTWPSITTASKQLLLFLPPGLFADQAGDLRVIDICLHRMFSSFDFRILRTFTNIGEFCPDIVEITLSSAIDPDVSPDNLSGTGHYTTETTDTPLVSPFNMGAASFERLSRYLIALDVPFVVDNEPSNILESARYLLLSHLGTTRPGYELDDHDRKPLIYVTLGLNHQSGSQMDAGCTHMYHENIEMKFFSRNGISVCLIIDVQDLLVDLHKNSSRQAQMVILPEKLYSGCYLDKLFSKLGLNELLWLLERLNPEVLPWRNHAFRLMLGQRLVSRLDELPAQTVLPGLSQLLERVLHEERVDRLRQDLHYSLSLVHEQQGSPRKTIEQIEECLRLGKNTSTGILCGRLLRELNIHP